MPRCWNCWAVGRVVSIDVRTSPHDCQAIQSHPMARRVTLIERNLSRISHYMALAETVPVDSLSGAALYRREQLELPGGITDNLAGELSGVRENLADQLQTLGAHQSLPASLHRGSSHSSIRVSRLYLASRSDRVMDPTLI